MNWIWILIIKKKKPITDHFDFGLCYFILVTGKFFEKNFFIDIYINFKSILEKFFKKNKLQYTLFRGLGNNWNHFRRILFLEIFMFLLFCEKLPKKISYFNVIKFIFNFIFAVFFRKKTYDSKKFKPKIFSNQKKSH